ncbi:hypothetical protein PspLS_03440 [Pyricularia sp. CBS 133598]|nr:hypothetical protein PspLS_03440 [Pyricularia sp. CBS 133598]
MGDRRHDRDESSDEELELYSRPKSLPSPPKSPNDPKSPSAHYMRVDADENAQLLSPGRFNFHEDDDDDDDDGLDDLEAGERTPVEEQSLAAKPARRRGWSWWPRRRGGDPNGNGHAKGGGAERAAGTGCCGLRIPPWLVRPLVILPLFPWDGPDEHAVHSITPFFPNIQDYPVRWLEYRLGTGTPRRTALAMFTGLWLLLFTLFLSIGYSGYGGSPPIVHLSCTDTLWPDGNDCGLNGIDCKPFSNHTFTVHCPPGCASVGLPEPRFIGTELLQDSPLVIGSGFYRGDSYLCASAIHAGVLSNGGGCGQIKRKGPGTQFHASDANGVKSIAFDSYFPMAFTVVESDTCGISNPTVPLLILTLLFTIVICIFTVHPPALFFSVLAALFAFVGLASDPPPVSHYSTTVLPELLSTFAARLLPAVFVALTLYHFVICRALGGDFPRTGLLPLRAQYEKLWLWLLPLWLGAMANHVLGWAFLTRFKPFAIVIAAALICAAAAQQAVTLWREGRLPGFMRLYGALLAALVLSAILLPGVELQTPPYALALVLLPLTAVQTRPSLAYQGFLLGLLVNSAARNGFAPVLLPHHRPVAHPLPSLLGEPRIKDVPGGYLSIAFEWVVPTIDYTTANENSVIEGISVLVNDVERHRAFFQEPKRDKQHGAGGAKGFVWARAEGADFPEYFRFGYIREGKKALEYTKAGVWNANGTWVPPEGS